jgi:GGDEF domain-containing protein
MEVVLFLIAALLAALVVYVRNLHRLVGALSINPNFNVVTRVAALEMVGQRRVVGKQSVVTFDVAGMGKTNQQHGEQWVNRAIKDALAEVRSTLRASDLVAQLNSGDEFFVVTTGDVTVVQAKVQEAFAKHWPGGIYIASCTVQGDVMEAVVASMERVYEIKAVKKGLAA